jgi:DNA repair photolyase
VFVRWDNLTLESDDTARLPGYRDAAVVRHFDAPEALDTRFYEIRAKSALNRVPERSAMPFRWTINPYRGCSHACVYCAAGDTPILMADGRTKPLADLRPGDRVYGTVQRGRYRRYEPTDVLAHWSSVKPAYRVMLEDGTELVASADHRFLSGRGWKHVTGDEQGADRRPHLTVDDALLGSGRFARGPDETADYRRGYLCGMIRGDGHLGSYSHEHADRTHEDVHRFRLALADEEALERVQTYLDSADVATDRFAFAAGTATRKPIAAVRTQRRSGVERIQELIRWPLDPGDDWRKGFLAGIFDAEGAAGGDQALRIANADRQVLDWTAACLRRLGFDHVVEPTRHANGLRHVRLLGGLVARMRFFLMTDPAITRKRDIAGLALKCAGSRRVVSVEPLGVAMRLYDITTGTGDFVANGIVSHNCFARPTHTYLGFDAGRDFEKEIVVKVNVPEVLRAELARPSWKGEHVALGTNTDPYQWVEGRYKLMPGIWEAMRDAANPCSVLTKSPLLLRDLPLMKQIAARTDFTASLSIPTIDEQAWRATEPHTPNPKARMEAVAELNRQGIPAGILVAPLMPGINDSPAQVERILQMATDAGATAVSGIALHLRGEVRGVFMDWLRATRPDLVPQYERLYARGAYAPKDERQRLSRLVRDRAEASRRAPAWRLRTRARALPGARDAGAAGAAGAAAAKGAGDARAGERPSAGAARARAAPAEQQALF